MQDLLKPLESQRKHLEEGLDEAFQNYIKKKYGYACVLSGEKKSGTIFYLFGCAMYPNTRWNEFNAVTLCRREREKYYEGHPFAVLDWYVKTFGQEKIDELRSVAEGKTKVYSIQEIINMTNDYIKRTRELPAVKAHNGRVIK